MDGVLELIANESEYVVKSTRRYAISPRGSAARRDIAGVRRRLFRCIHLDYSPRLCQRSDRQHVIPVDSCNGGRMGACAALRSILGRVRAWSGYGFLASS